MNVFASIQGKRKKPETFDQFFDEVVERTVEAWNKKGVEPPTEVSMFLVKGDDVRVSLKYGDVQSLPSRKEFLVIDGRSMGAQKRTEFFEIIEGDKGRRQLKKRDVSAEEVSWEGDKILP